VNARSTPSLRIARLVVANFRTFRDATEIPLSSESGADAMPVFHGPNGSGKSNALAAIELFFRAASCWLSSGASPAIQNASPNALPDLQLPWGWDDERSGLALSHRSWPAGSREPQIIELHFSDPKLAALRVVLAPSGNDVRFRLEDAQGSPREFVPLRTRERAIWLANTLDAPTGPGSKPFFRLNARRADFRSIGGGAAPREVLESALSGSMAERLLAMATSLEPDETERWRSFVSLVGRFKTLNGREVSVVRGGNSGADLRFEVRGKQILQLSELSSGEQQVIALTAAVLTSRAAIVAVEEPEISLHPDNQTLVREMLAEQVTSGIVDQIILESHVPVFDGPEVVRFSRSPEGITSVSRQPSASARDAQLRAVAKEHGATEQWVTSEGYTQLHGEMLRDLGLEQGGNLWFLRGASGPRWQAWKADELDRIFGFGEEEEAKDK
jgi:hypothetical protein